MGKELLIVISMSLSVISAYADPHREVSFGQINVLNNGSGVLLCGIGGMPSYTGSYNEQNVSGEKFLLPYMKSPVGEHYDHDDPMGSGAMSPYFAYYANSNGKNMAMFTVDGWVTDTSYNASTSKDYIYDPVSLDYYSYDANDTMRNLIRVGVGAAYIITPNQYNKDLDGTDHLNPFSTDVFSSQNLNYVSFSQLEPKSGWYDNGYTAWGNQWFTHQYIMQNGTFSHAFKFLQDFASDHTDKYDQPESMGVACLVYDSLDDAKARAPYGQGLIGSFKIRFKIDPASESASVVPESYDPKIIVSQSYSSTLAKTRKTKGSKHGAKSMLSNLKEPSLGGAPGVDEDQNQTAIIKTYTINY
ncbi:hypothetical protein [Fangia hongkongensis]|uniref:hypothetical protein n=1 Tax=Fangia hongkongensis TaxID=270495 RepID=UPI00037840EE|nr:hypothetical protein [Fangia hongkongensis]MBK2124187.1 hypothetical protein [Fangia hongkongensis]